MSRLQPGHERRWRHQRLVAVLVVVGGVLESAITFLTAWPLPFHVPGVLVLVPGVIGLVLLVVALVLTIPAIRELPW